VQPRIGGSICIEKDDSICFNQSSNVQHIDLCVWNKINLTKVGPKLICYGPEWLPSLLELLGQDSEHASLSYVDHGPFAAVSRMKNISMMVWHLR